MKRDLPSLRNLDVSGKTVLVRGDFDVDDGDNPRANSIRNIVRLLIERQAKAIRVIGHSETKYDLAGELKKEFPEVGFDVGLRNDAREKASDMGFAEELAEDWEVFVNESFAVAHRKHTSEVMLPRIFKRDGKAVCVGPRFEKEVEMLSEVWDRPGRRVLVIGGVKVEDKARFAENMKDKFVAVLKGGLLPGVDLRPDGLDISDAVIEKYCRIISEAEVILAAGVMGKYEDVNASKGTQTVLGAIAKSKAYKVAGGGDIEMAISQYSLTDKFDWISVGGGAMLEYLGTGTLPGLEAIVS